MRPPDPPELLARFRALPAAQPLLGRLEGVSDVYLVGGAVRDLLLGSEPFDLDLVVEGDPGPALARLDGEVILHDRFGTSSVHLDGRVYDLARARRENYARPGALPEVTPAGLEEDLRRRDFTVNALAMALGGAEAGVVVAYPGALDDLTRQQLRVLHPRSFIDDPTRLLRMARYRARLDFAIEDETRRLAREAVAQGALDTVSGPRLGHELKLLAAEPDPIAALAAVCELGIDHAIDRRFGVDDEALARRALELLPADGRPDLLALAVATHGLARADLRRLLDRLGFEAAEREVVVAAATGAESLASELQAAGRPSQLAAAAYGKGPELVALGGALGPREAARAWLTSLRHVELEIDGGDLLAAGVPEGPAVGRGLQAALAAKLDGRATSREAELETALQAARGDG